MSSVDGIRIVYGDGAYGRKSVRRRIEGMDAFLITPKRRNEGVSGLYGWIVRNIGEGALDRMRYEIRGRVEYVIGEIKKGARERGRGENWILFEAVRMNYKAYVAWEGRSEEVVEMEEILDRVEGVIREWRDMMLGDDKDR